MTSETWRVVLRDGSVREAPSRLDPFRLDIAKPLDIQHSARKATAP